MPQGTNSTMCVGQAKHYQLCQQQVRTASSTDLSGGCGTQGVTAGVTGPSEECRQGVRSTPGVVPGVPLKMGQMGSTVWG